jgi:SOS-response transcriptional repressor LexA
MATSFIHPIQKQLLELSSTEDITVLSLGQLGKRLGVYPQIIKHHWQQLDKKGLLPYKPKGVATAGYFEYKPSFHLLTIPVLGNVTAGTLRILAEENLAGYLKISSTLRQRSDGLFAVKVSGESMNRATVHGKLIRDGSHVIADSKNKGENGDIVVVAIDGCATVKRIEVGTSWIKFQPESTKSYQPIILAREEGEAHVCGKVIDVF